MKWRQRNFYSSHSSFRMGSLHQGKNRDVSLLLGVNLDSGKHKTGLRQGWIKRYEEGNFFQDYGYRILRPISYCGSTRFFLLLCIPLFLTSLSLVNFGLGLAATLSLLPPTVAITAFRSRNRLRWQLENFFLPRRNNFYLSLKKWGTYNHNNRSTDQNFFTLSLSVQPF